MSSKAPPLRFGRYSFWPAPGELRRDEARVKLQAQPAKVLAALTRQPGEIVSRERLTQEVWGRGTHVDFERGLNFCIAQIRSALGDSAESPAYVETIPKQGYRFIAPIEVQPVGSTSESPPPPDRAGENTSSWSRRGGVALAAVSLIVVALIGWAKASWTPATVVVVPFYNETGAPQHARTAAALGDATVARLATSERIESLRVIGNAGTLRNPFARQDVQQIARDLDAQWVLIGQLKSDGQKLRVIAHLIRVSDMRHLWAETFDDEAFDLDGQSRAAEGIAAAVTTSLTTTRK